MNSVPANQSVSYTVYIQAVGNSAGIPVAFLRANDARIMAAFDMGEPVWMISDEMKLRHEMQSVRPHKTPRQLALRVNAF